LLLLPFVSFSSVCFRPCRFAVVRSVPDAVPCVSINFHLLTAIITKQTCSSVCVRMHEDAQGTYSALRMMRVKDHCLTLHVCGLRESQLLIVVHKPDGGSVFCWHDDPAPAALKRLGSSLTKRAFHANQIFPPQPS
jgi:hypothetical protein